MLCSPIVALQWHQNRWHWMTLNLNDHFPLKSVSGSATNKLALAFLAFGQNCSKIWRATYCPRQNCSPGILVSSKVRFMWIFAGVCWKGGVKWEWGRRKWRLSLYLPNLHIQSHNNYIILCNPLVTLHWHRNGWPWMTLKPGWPWMVILL